MKNDLCGLVSSRESDRRLRREIYYFYDSSLNFMFLPIVLGHTADEMTSDRKFSSL